MNKIKFENKHNIIEFHFALGHAALTRKKANLPPINEKNSAIMNKNVIG